MKRGHASRYLSLLLTIAIIMTMLPQITFIVRADTVTSITDLDSAGFLGRGFNLLGNSPLENGTLADKRILKSMENIDALITDTRDTEYLFTYIKDFSSFMQNESSSATYSAEVSAKIKIVTLEAKAKYGLQSASSYEENNKTEYAVLSILRTYDKKYMDLSSTKYIQRIWQQNGDGTYITLNDDFVDELYSVGTSDQDLAAFFARYGTHIITRYVSGGEAILSYSGKDLSSAATHSSSTEFNASAKVDVKSIVSISADMEQKGAQESNSSVATSDISFTGSVRGGDKTMEPSQIFEMMKGGNTAINEWANSINGDNSQIIVDDRPSNEEDSLQLLPIWELLYRPEDAQLKVAMEEYFNRNVNQQYAEFYESYIYNPAQDPDYSDYTFITSAEQLNQVRNDLAGKYVLLCDINLGNTEWTPIGTADAPFTGVIDGNGCTIFGLSVTKCADKAAGLFGYNKGTIKNLSVQGSVNVDGTGNANNVAYIGGIAGYNTGDILNCKNMVNLNGQLTANNVSAATPKEGLAYDMDAINALLTEKNTYDLTTYEGGTINLDNVAVVKLKGTAQNPINLTVTTYSATPLYIILENAVFTGDSANGTIYSNCARPIWIISVGDDTATVGKNVISGTLGANAINVAEALLYLVGDAELEITGGNGTQGVGYKTGNDGNDGAPGKEAINAAKVYVDAVRISLIGGDGGRGADGKDGAASTNAGGLSQSSRKTAGTGEAGGNGGTGGAGALPVVKDVEITVYNGNIYCYGGRGGDGGNGGDGGRGADGSDTAEYVKYAAIGGAGGRGGDGGNGGVGGLSVYSSVSGVALIMLNDSVAYVIQANYGKGGNGGDGGDGGTGGDGVPYDGAKAYPTNYEDKTKRGFDGAKGGTAGCGGDAGSGSTIGTAGNAGTPGNGGARGHLYEQKWIGKEMHYGSSGANGDISSNGSEGTQISITNWISVKTASRIYDLYNSTATASTLKDAGKILVSIGSEKEQQLINEMLKFGGAESYWIGLSWDSTENRWVWEDDNYFITPSELDCLSSNGKYVFGNSYDRFGELAYDNWNAGEPQNVGAGEKAVQIYSVFVDSEGNSLLGFWDDLSVSSATGGYITETEIESNIKIDPAEDGVYAGGIVGYNAFEGKVSNCINVGDITVNKAYSERGQIIAATGGIAGVNVAAVMDCYNQGKIEAVAKSDSLNGVVGAYAYEITMNLEDGTETGSVCTGNCCSTSTKSNVQTFTGITSADANSVISENVQEVLDYWKHSALSITRVNKTDYVQGQEFDRASIDVTLNGAPVEKYTVWYYFLSTGSRVVKISYSSGDNTYQRTIPVQVSAPTAENVEISQNSNHKTQFFVGDTFEFDGLVLTICLTNGENQSVVATLENVLAPDLSNAGEKTVEINYQGLITNYKITVEPVLCKEIEITTLPAKLNYLEGEELSLSGMVVTATYNNGKEEVVTDYEISGYDSTPGPKTIKVSYNGCETSFAVVVTEKTLTSIAVTKLPEKMIYKEGEALDITGMVVTAYYDNNTNEAVTGYQVSGYDTIPGTKEVMVSYGGYTANFTVKVEAKKLQSIAITKAPNKTVYEVGETLDLAGMVVTAYYDNGTDEVVTGYEVSGYDATKGTKTVTVTYKEKQATFTAVVEKTVHSTDPQIIVGSATAIAGDTVTVDVLLQNNPGISSVVLKINYDTTRLKLESAQFGDTFSEGAFVNFNLPYVTLVRSGNCTENVSLLTLTFGVLPDAETGETYVTLDYSEGDITNYDEEDVTFAVVPGNVTVIDYVPGDINGDNKVNSKDLTRLLKYISHEEVTVNEAALDINGDGKVNSKDLTRLLKYISHEDVEIH